MQPWRPYIVGLPALLPVLAAMVLCAGEGQAKGATGQGVMKTYRTMMARNCRIKPKAADTANTVFNQNIRLSEQWIRVRHVQKGWKGWVRVHVVCRVPGGTAWGYADLQLKSGEIRCDSANWDSMITPPLSANR